MKKILRVAGRPCSCPVGIVCSTCTAPNPKTRLKPRIHVTTSRNPHIPITITRFHERRPTLVKIKESLSSLRLRKSPQKEPDKSIRSSISRWYGRRKAIREQNIIEQKERRSLEKEKEELRKAQKQFKKEQEAQQKLLRLEEIENAKLERERQEKEREKEVLKYYKEQEEQRRLQEIEREKEEQLKSYYTPQLRAETIPFYKEEDGKQKKVKEKKVKQKKRKAKKDKLDKFASDKTVFVRKFNRRESWKDRLSHWFYRFCCQLYCYITCVLAVVFVLIFII